MPSTRQRIALHKRNLRNGALLAVSEAAKQINIPLAQDVARHIQQVAIALKAPKDNDLNARELETRVGGLLGVLGTSIQQLERSSEGVHEELLQLQTHLTDTHTELQDIQNSRSTTKLVSQAEIRDRILYLKEELSGTIVDITLRLLAIVLAAGAQDRRITVRHFKSATHKHDILAQKHHTLAHRHHILVRQHAALGHAHRVVQRRQRMSDERIRDLQRNCKGLTQQVNAVLLIRRTDA
ncbi:hypothetical protein FRC11_006617 [Ceratobasidium sp. 423]|nr:hypothetical protein FRC11_006617 [Ceratobasidium sp. 423]